MTILQNVDYAKIEREMLASIDWATSMKLNHQKNKSITGETLWAVPRKHAVTVIKHVTPCVDALEALYIAPEFAVMFYAFNKVHTQLDMVALVRRDPELGAAAAAVYDIADTHPEGAQAVRDLMYTAQRHQRRALRARQPNRSAALTAHARRSRR